MKRRRIINGVKGVNRVVNDIMSKPPVTARKQDVGADRDPEGEIADKRYLDEHAKDRKDRQYERYYNCMFTAHISRAATRRQKPGGRNGRVG